MVLVGLHAIVCHVEGDTRHVQETISDTFLNQIAFVAAADGEIVEAIVLIDLWDVPQNRLAADFGH